MIFNKTKISGLYIIEPELKKDERGYFSRIFCQEELARNGLDFGIVQANISLTLQKGTVRGMHFQKEPKAEAKIVRCLRGIVYDVVIDLRKESPTFEQWVAEELSGDNKKMFYIPKDFAHGFQSLTENCEMEYFMSEFYSPEHASGVRWDDPKLEIEWPLPVSGISDKDKNWPLIDRKQ